MNGTGVSKARCGFRCSFLLLLVLAGCNEEKVWTASPEACQGLDERIDLREGWFVQTSTRVEPTGRELSSPAFVPEGWYAASVPSTVLAVLVENGVHPDPYFGMNLRSIPGTDYPIGSNFSEWPMSPDSPFRPSWWYRTSFEIPARYEGRAVFLHFDGINYRANIWLNGIRVADRETAVGAYRRFAFDVTAHARPGSTNALAVEVFSPEVLDLAISWVDWNPTPADKNMGLWRDVYVTVSGPVVLDHPQVITDLDLPRLDRARLEVSVEARNTQDEPVKGVLHGRVGEIGFSCPVDLDPRESRLVSFSPDRFPQLDLSSPSLWWPAGLGAQPLHDLVLRFEVDGTVSDREQVRFGIREVTSALTENGHRLFQVNGKNVFIRGAGWAPDMMLRSSPDREEAEIRYVKDLHVNAIRLEGKLGTDHLLDLCDRYGILVMAGWCCCSHWERWPFWDREDHEVARESLRDQAVRLRNHPSVFDWLNGSDFPPPPEVEAAYIDVLEQVRWPNPYQSSATETPTPVSGETGLKMTGPYEYVTKTRKGAVRSGSTPRPVPARPCRPWTASAGCCPRSTSGPSTNSGISMQGEEVFGTSGSSAGPWRKDTERPPVSRTSPGRPRQ